MATDISHIVITGRRGGNPACHYGTGGRLILECEA